jgi:hypothetical protein
MHELRRPVEVAAISGHLTELRSPLQRLDEPEIFGYIFTGYLN